MAGPIFCDVFRSERLLLSYVDLKVILNQNVNEFCLMASKAYLKIRKVKLTPSISIAHELALKKGPAIYPIRHVDCKTFIISAGNPSLRKENVFTGLVPKTFAMVMVDIAAFNGDYKKNPFNLKDFYHIVPWNRRQRRRGTLQTLTAFLHGRKSQIYRSILTIFSGAGKLFYNAGNDVTRDEYAGGYAVYVADLTPEMCGLSPPF